LSSAFRLFGEFRNDLTISNVGAFLITFEFILQDFDVVFLIPYKAFVCGVTDTDNEVECTLNIDEAILKLI
jgi:hypothetical protein